MKRFLSQTYILNLEKLTQFPDVIHASEVTKSGHRFTLSYKYQHPKFFFLFFILLEYICIEICYEIITSSVYTSE